MGYTKRKLEQNEHESSVATSILLQTKNIIPCEYHLYNLKNNDDLVPDYKLANHLITINDPLVSNITLSRSGLSDLIKEEYQNAYDDCPGCLQREDD